MIAVLHSICYYLQSKVFIKIIRRRLISSAFHIFITDIQKYATFILSFNELIIRELKYHVPYKKKCKKQEKKKGKKKLILLNFKTCKHSRLDPIQI